VDFADFAALAYHWLIEDCGNCDGAVLTCDGNVNTDDLNEWTNYLLAGA
jgi:hypothetical protein